LAAWWRWRKSAGLCRSSIRHGSVQHPQAHVQRRGCWSAAVRQGPARHHCWGRQWVGISERENGPASLSAHTKYRSQCRLATGGTHRQLYSEDSARPYTEFEPPRSRAVSITGQTRQAVVASWKESGVGHHQTNRRAIRGLCARVGPDATSDKYAPSERLASGWPPRPGLDPEQPVRTVCNRG
jgi:hypothetical protein